MTIYINAEQHHDDSGIGLKVDVVDGFHDVPDADSVNNVVVRDVVGNKTDTVAGNSLVALAKIIKAKTDNLPSDPADESNQLAVHTVPAQNAVTNTNMRDVVGNKTDTTAGDSIVALTKAIKAKTDNLPADPMVQPAQYP